MVQQFGRLKQEDPQCKSHLVNFAKPCFRQKIGPSHARHVGHCEDFRLWDFLTVINQLLIKNSCNIFLSTQPYQTITHEKFSSHRNNTDLRCLNGQVWFKKGRFLLRKIDYNLFIGVGLMDLCPIITFLITSQLFEDESSWIFTRVYKFLNSISFYF